MKANKIEKGLTEANEELARALVEYGKLEVKSLKAHRELKRAKEDIDRLIKAEVDVDLLAEALMKAKTKLSLAKIMVSHYKYLVILHTRMVGVDGEEDC